MKNEGHEVINPVTTKHDHDLTWELYVKEDIRHMMTCDAIYMLVGYTASKGAMIEYRLAKDIGMKVIYQGLHIASPDAVSDYQRPV